MTRHKDRNPLTTKGRSRIHCDMVDMAVYSIPCVTCGAQAWERCHTAGGVDTSPHGRRARSAQPIWRAFDNALGYTHCPICEEQLNYTTKRHVCPELPPGPVHFYWNGRTPCGVGARQVTTDCDWQGVTCPTCRSLGSAACDEPARSPIEVAAEALEVAAAALRKMEE